MEVWQVINCLFWQWYFRCLISYKKNDKHQRFYHPESSSRRLEAIFMQKEKKNQKHRWSQNSDNSACHGGRPYPALFSFGTEPNLREYQGFDLLMISLQHFNCIFMLRYVFNHGMRTIVVAQASTSCHCRATTPVALGQGQRWCPWVGWRHEGCAPLPGSQHLESTTHAGSAW